MQVMSVRNVDGANQKELNAMQARIPYGLDLKLKLQKSEEGEKE